MNYWVFKCNPTKYRIKDRLKDPRDQITWITPRHAQDIEKGDIAFIWQTGSDKQRGIVGVIKIDAVPVKMPELREELDFWVESGGDARLRVRGTIIHRCDLVLSTDLRKVPELQNLRLFHGFQQGTIFPIAEEHGKFLLAILNRD